MTFDQWKQATGFDAASTFTKGPPTKLRVIVRPSVHEKGRANIAVLNLAKLAEVEVDLSAVLDRGQGFRIVSAKDYFGMPLVSGTFDGQPVRLPMKPIQGPPPVGMPDVTLPVTEPQFGAFVVLPQVGAEAVTTSAW